MLHQIIEVPKDFPESFLRPVEDSLIGHPETFPIIETIDDVSPYVRDDGGIRFFDHGVFTVCRYTSAIPGTFQTALDLECRSLIFCSVTGILLSRPFHKFFNMGERQGLYDIDFDERPEFLTKIDGSMIAGFVHNGKVVFHTRGGVSRQALAALSSASAGVLALTREAFEMGMTPVFEWTSPDNRVIINYAKAEMTLLAVRSRRDGTYHPELADDLAAKHGVTRPVPIGIRISSLEEFIAAYADLRDRTDIEGAILRFPNGRLLKLKTRDYLRRHKILANLDNEKYAWLAVLDNVIDDTAAALGGSRARYLTDYATQMLERIDEVSATVAGQVDPLRDLDPRERAQQVRALFNGTWQSLAFTDLKGGCIKSHVFQLMHRRASGAETRTALRQELDLPEWAGGLPDIS
jgi:RNA ligase